MEKFRIVLTRDVLSEDGELVFKDIGLSLLDEVQDIEYEFMKEHRPVVTPDQIKGLRWRNLAEARIYTRDLPGR